MERMTLSGVFCYFFQGVVSQPLFGLNHKTSNQAGLGAGQLFALGSEVFFQWEEKTGFTLVNPVWAVGGG